jgi:hypothetical protein
MRHGLEVAIVYTAASAAISLMCIPFWGMALLTRFVRQVVE